MREIKTEIVINRSPSDVWKVLMNFPLYPQWSRFIEYISGPAEEGKRLEVRLKPANKQAAVFAPLVLFIRPEKEFRWKGQFADVNFIFTGEHYFILHAEDSGRKTRLEHGEKFRGLLTFIMGRIIKITRNGLLDYNFSLKERCEKK